ncbi:MAG: diguanylate cyclase, partial [Candidatus Hydrogenedentota bacterium]
MNILIADDDLLSRRMLNGLLTKFGHTMQSVDNGADAWKALDTDDPPHVAILDWAMPGLSGVEICHLLRARERTSNTYVYVILLTARDAREDVMAGLQAGADDYVVKPFDAHELRVRLNAGRRIHQLQTDLMAAQRKLEERARTDSLTGVLNHSAIAGALEKELVRAEREGGHVSIGMIDIDHFKAINDSIGHQAGDLVLRGCVERIEKCIRPYDALGRYGGEEFLLVVNGPIDTGSSNVFERAV